MKVMMNSEEYPFFPIWLGIPAVLCWIVFLVLTFVNPYLIVAIPILTWTGYVAMGYYSICVAMYFIAIAQYLFDMS